MTPCFFFFFFSILTKVRRKLDEDILAR